MKLFAKVYLPTSIFSVFLSWGLFSVASAYPYNHPRSGENEMGSKWVLRILAGVIIVIWVIRHFWRQNECYLVEYCCFKPLEERKMHTDLCEYFVRRHDNLKEDDVKFQLKVLLKSGLGEETYGPAFMFKEDYLPSIKEGRLEFDENSTQTLDALFEKTGISPSEIDILVVNISCFSPSPSLAASIINHYKMREDIKVYNLAGMGCSASLIAVDLAKDLLRVHENSFAVVFSSESVSQSWYAGNERSMMVTNCLFRVGGCALLLTNKPAFRNSAKLKLVHTVRTHIGANSDGYLCVQQREDDDGITGYSLSNRLIDSATEALKKNITTLGPKVLPITEQLKYVYNILWKKKKSDKPYVPNFKKAFEHFCIHPGGPVIVDGVGKSLNLNEYDVEPSRMTLHRFGNTSASCLWYVLAYMEAKGRLKKGDSVWMIGFGSGFKCNSGVWKVVRDLELDEGKKNDDGKDNKKYYGNVWKECIWRYPPSFIANPFEQLYRKRMLKDK
ncbi:hypothetical protein SUGI_0034900 [Cryptomeria japonica]|uniref:3-ketoacyl-CoA synthase 12 n=1 Tax=Cryptomeria japonica TaxID=3369 RepID=UPI002408AABD|nr:3-ketoacyl-CoA synthase 12 [Cryptomeria japonica]GLJ06272.1 hypothetical protein SUGI_0034900 [Cryptomeria japonica]